MDGVLIEAKQWHFDALNRALNLFGYAISLTDHYREFDGLPTKVKLARLSAKSSLPASLHGFINRMKQQYTLELARECLRPNPIHVETLARLKREGYTLGLASNSVRPTVDLMMKLSGLDKFLDFTLSNNDVTLPKPSPEIYFRAIAKANVSPSECLVLEDNPHGWQAATEAETNLLKIAEVSDVNYANISRRISEVDRLDGDTSIRRAA
ncbi:HAD-IA family hydrolase [Bremerella sp. JC770]|uniref:HAD family hydrolase n=1 Tax=Bremerella sp. JC770 TaxID=3232137 RepID=UPI0034598601